MRAMHRSNPNDEAFTELASFILRYQAKWISDESNARLSTSTWLATNQHDKEYRKEEVVLERVRLGIRCQLKTEGVCGQ